MPLAKCSTNSPTKQPMVAPSIYGEPLLIPNLREVYADMKRRGIAIAMNTNGLTLTEDLAEFFCQIKVELDHVQP